jgi:hypothetical protein
MLLDADQRSLLADLRSGAALRGPVAPTSARTREVLAEFGAREQQVEALRRDITELDVLLGAVFESGSWRLGYGMTALRRLLRRGELVSAVDRWRRFRRPSA